MRKPIGQEAAFLIPSDKLQEEYGGNKLINLIEEFLTKNFGAFHVSNSEIKGFWAGSFDGVYTEFVIAFLGKERILLLQHFLHSIAYTIDHECIYLRLGYKIGLEYPEKGQTYRL